MDNYGTHEHPGIRDCFARHPEFVSHFAPTNSFWLNQVERFLARITERRPRRGGFKTNLILDKLRKLAERTARLGRLGRPVAGCCPSGGR